MDRRFSGLERLFGTAGAACIRSSHVVVVGIGGVGSWAVEALARSGVGKLTLIDMDHVSESNINRQLQAVDSTVGQSKVIAMRNRIHSFHSECQVECVDDFVTAENWPSLISLSVNAVIDACDQVKAKTAMASWARQTKTHFISVGAAGGKRHPHLVDVDDLSRTTHDPLLAQVRYRLRKEHGAPKESKKMGVTCVFSREAVLPPDPTCAIEGDGSLNCHGYGSIVSVTATFGQCAAGWVLNQLAASK